MLDNVSEANLQGVAPEVAAMVREAAARLEAMGVWIHVVCGLRTPAEQNRLYNQGRNGNPGKIVTNAMAGQSMHNYGLAVDVVPFLIGSTGQLNWRADSPQFQHMVAALKDAGLEWGGDWLGKLGDFDHFQVSGLKPSPTPAMRFDYTRHAGDLAVIWQKVSEGQYA